MQTTTQEVPPEVLDQLKRLYLVGRDKADPDRGYGLTTAEVSAADTLNGYAAEIERLERVVAGMEWLNGKLLEAAKSMLAERKSRSAKEQEVTP